MINRNSNLVGVVPAAGYARRISPLISCSKEIYPVRHPDGNSTVVSSYLMDSFKQAGVKQAYWILRNGKWDIPDYYIKGAKVDLDLAYIVVDSTSGVPETIDVAYPFVNNKTVLMGFPDIMFTPLNAFHRLVEKQFRTGADLVLGLFKTDDPSKADMVVLDEKEKLKEIIIKPPKSNLKYTWIIGVWTPVFSTFLHKYLIQSGRTKAGELYIGDVVREALNSGLKTDYVKFDDGTFLDIGTPGDLEKARSINWLKNEA